MIRKIPLYILIFITGVSLGNAITKHGEYQTGKHNAWISLAGYAIQWTLILWMYLP